METLAERLRKTTPPESRWISTQSLLVLHRLLWIIATGLTEHLGVFLLAAGPS